MAVFTTITGTLGANSAGLNGTIFVKFMTQIVLSDGTVVPVGTIVSENVTAGNFTIELPATDTASPADTYSYWTFREDGTRLDRYLGRRLIPTSATDVDWSDLV